MPARPSHRSRPAARRRPTAATSFSLPDAPSLNGAGPHRYATVQANVTDTGVLTALAALRASLPAADVLEAEAEPHVTVRWGLHDSGSVGDDGTAAAVRLLLEREPAAAYTLGNLSVFTGTPNGDVLKVAVLSPDLVRLNRKLGLLPNTQTHPYSPHLTVAYMKPGTADRFVGPAAGLAGRRLTAAALAYRPSTAARAGGARPTELPLTGDVVTRPVVRVTAPPEGATSRSAPLAPLPVAAWNAFGRPPQAAEAAGLDALDRLLRAAAVENARKRPPAGYPDPPTPEGTVLTPHQLAEHLAMAAAAGRPAEVAYGNKPDAFLSFDHPDPQDMANHAKFSWSAGVRSDRSPLYLGPARRAALAAAARERGHEVDSGHNWVVVKVHKKPPPERDPMSLAAEAATDQAANVSHTDPSRAALHRHAAALHAYARDKADEEGRGDDAARHRLQIAHHSRVASQLDPEGGGATVNADPSGEHLDAVRRKESEQLERRHLGRPLTPHQEGAAAAASDILGRPPEHMGGNGFTTDQAHFAWPEPAAAPAARLREFSEAGGHDLHPGVVGWVLLRVRRRPPDDPMSLAADRLTAAAAEHTTLKPADRAGGADRHREAATAHAVARDKADEDGRTGDAEWHKRVLDWHSSEAERLHPEGGGATVNKKGDGDNCGDGAGGFRKGNTCAAESGAGDTTGGGPVAPAKEKAAARRLAERKIKDAPVPTPEQVKRARAELELAKQGKIRAGGYAGGNHEDRRRQRRNLFREFGGEERGYVVCPWSGLRMHWTEDPAENPEGLPVLERGKILTKYQGGGYNLANLIPESFSANRSRGDKPLRPENLGDEPTGNARHRNTGGHLGWDETAAQVEPGGRDHLGRFESPGGVVGRYRPGARREATASEDERAHGEFVSIIPGGVAHEIWGHGTVPGVTGGGHTVYGTTDRSPDDVRKSLVGAGYGRSPAQDRSSAGRHAYRHPDGHYVTVYQEPVAAGRRGVFYEPNYGPDHPDPVSRAADADSLRTHVKTGAAESGGPAARLEAARFHRAASLSHQVARDKAEEDVPARPADAARHVRQAAYHDAVADRLEREAV